MVNWGNLSSGWRKPVLRLRVSMPHFPQRPLSPLSHNEFVRLDVETRARHRHSIRVIHGRRAGLEDERPQLREVLTPIVKIRKTVPAKDGLADPIPSPGQSSALFGAIMLVIGGAMQLEESLSSAVGCRRDKLQRGA
jgi:hypothetical protein